MPLPLIMAGVGLAAGIGGAVGKMFGRKKQNKELEKLIGLNPAYQANPLAAEKLNLARSLMNARMPGAATAERNIFTNQANFTGNVNRNATDASQALSLMASGQANTNESLENLSTQEAQDYQRRYGNMSNAQDDLINENDKVFQDQVRRFNDLAAIRGAQSQNKQATWGDISGLGFGIANFALGAGGDKLGQMLKKQ